MKNLMAILLVLGIAAPMTARAGDVHYEGTESWGEFESFMRKREEDDRVQGLSYMISGLIASVGGVAGYYSSEDVFGRGVFAISETLGVAALGYGASLYWNGNDYSSFYRAVRDSSLSPLQKDELLRRFLANEAEERDRARWIRAGTHFLLAGLNLYSASRENNTDVKNIFQFLAGLNLVIGFSYSF